MPPHGQPKRQSERETTKGRRTPGLGGWGSVKSASSICDPLTCCDPSPRSPSGRPRRNKNGAREGGERTLEDQLQDYSV